MDQLGLFKCPLVPFHTYSQLARLTLKASVFFQWLLLSTFPKLSPQDCDHRRITIEPPFHHSLDSFSVTVPPIVPQQSFIFNSTTSPFFIINNDRYRFSNHRPTS